MEKLLVCTMILCLTMMLLCLNVYADEKEDVIKELNAAIPEDIRGDINVEEENIAPSFADIIKLCIRTLRERIYAPAKTLACLLFVVSVGGLFRICSDMITNERLYHVFQLACGISMSLSIFAACSVSIDSVRSFLVRLREFLMALSPILTGLCITSGNPGAAAVTSAGISIFVTVCEVILSTFLVSLARMSFSLSICSVLGDNIPDLSGISKLIKRIFSLVTGFVVMLFCAVSTYQSIIFSGADSISFRTVRFAVGNAVPVVGASLGEALRVVSGAVSSLRATVGGVGVCVIFLLLIPSAVSLLLNMGAISIASSVSRMFSLDRECRFLDEVRAVYGQLLALTVSASFMLIFLLSVVSSVPLNLGGA